MSVVMSSIGNVSMTCVDSSIRVAPVASLCLSLKCSLVRCVDSRNSFRSGVFASVDMSNV